MSNKNSKAGTAADSSTKPKSKRQAKLLPNPVLAEVPYEYGAMSSKYRLMASNKLTAYATMCLHYQSSNHLIAIYSPESSKEDSWMSFDGKVAARLDEIFGGEDSFDKYLENNIEEIRKCYKSITQLV